MPYLHVITEELKGTRRELSAPEVRLSSDGVQVANLDSGPSSPSISFTRVGDTYRVEVEASSADVRLNGKPVRSGQLNHGDVLSVGSTEFVYGTERGDSNPGGNLPSSAPFAPRIPATSWIDRFSWVFTSEGRARHQLIVAHREPSATRLQQLSRILDRLVGGSRALRPSAASLRDDLASFLAWKAIERGETELAGNYLDCLPSSEIKAGLRWDLMTLLLTRGAHQEYLQQAKKYVADPIAGSATRIVTVPALMKTLYEVFSPATCSQVFRDAHQAIQSRPEVRSVQTLCESMATPDGGTPPAGQLDQTSLSFSRVMTADALLLDARAAEVRRDWDGMLNCALRALRAYPGRDTVNYWLTRAKLRRAAGRSDDHLAPSQSFESAPWQRLALLIAGHQQPALENAAALRPILEGRMGPCELMELDLVGELLRTTLVREPPTSAADVGAARDLARAVQSTVGALPWTHVVVAHGMVRLDRQFAAAYALLERDDVINQPGARRLARVARILAGSPVHENTVAVSDSVAAIETAMRRLLGPKPSDGQRDASTAAPRVERDDALLKEFPDLEPMTRVLSAGQHVTNGDSSAALAEMGLDLPPSAPAWLAWLDTRVRLLIRDSIGVPPVPMPCENHAPVAGWLLDCWLSNQSRPGIKKDFETWDLPPMLEGWLSSVSPAAAPEASTILAARRGGYRTFDAAIPKKPTLSVRSDLGELVDAIAALELRIEELYARARQDIGGRNGGRAVRELEVLLQDSQRLPAISAAWWRPLVQYWLGAAYAHQRDNLASRQWQELITSPREADARAQLALLALAENRIDDAATWLNDAPDDVPAVRYARAVVNSRRGESAAALALLVSDASVRAFAGSSYARAAERLAAAIEERTGLTAESEHRLEALVQSDPDDGVASIRLGRQRLERSYSEWRDGRFVADPRVMVGARRLDRVESTAPWWQKCLLFDAVLTASPDRFEELLERVRTKAASTEAWGWRQLFAAKALTGRRPDLALRAMDVGDVPGAPPWFSRSRVILRAWRALTLLGENPGSSVTLRNLEQLTADLDRAGDGDEMAVRLRTSIELAVSAATTGHGVPMQRWRETGNTRMTHVAALFDDDPQIRREAAETLRPAIDGSEPVWNDDQTQLLATLCAWAAGANSEFVERYDAIMPVGADSPVLERDLWVPAALIRFAKGDWKSLEGDRLPESLADMSDPTVALIVELADARATVGDLKNPSQKVAQRINGISRNLAALVEKLDP